MADSSPAQTPAPAHPPLTWRRKLLYRVIILLVLLFLVEGVCQLVLRFRYGGGVPENQRPQEYDAELGWINKVSFRKDVAAGVLLTHNSQRLRALKDYAPEVPKGRYRIICLGDSFTYGLC